MQQHFIFPFVYQNIHCLWVMEKGYLFFFLSFFHSLYYDLQKKSTCLLLVRMEKKILKHVKTDTFGSIY
jgi:hypothetical protein